MFECYIDKIIALSPNIDGLTKQLDSELIIKDIPHCHKKNNSVCWEVLSFHIFL